MQGYKRIFIFFTIGMMMLGSVNLASAQKKDEQLARYIQQLKSEDRNVRRSAASALGKLGDKRAVEPLIAVLKDEYIAVRFAAVSALGELGDKRAVEPLMAVLKDENISVRMDAARALVQLGEPAVQPLIAALKDEDVIVRREAAGALGQIDDKRAVKPLMAVLEDEDVIVRREAAGALGRIGPAAKDAVPALIEALSDADESVRISAAEALKKIGTPEALKAVEAFLADASDILRTAKLLHAEITSVKMPNAAEVNQPIIVDVIVTNGVGDSKAGGISVSFPDNPQAAIIDADTKEAAVYPVGSQIWSNTEKKTFPSQHILVETWYEPWKANEAHRLKLLVAPSEVGTLRVFVRATVTFPKGKGQIIPTPEAGPLDQQGFPVQEYTVPVMAQSKKVRYQSDYLGKVLAENVTDLRNIDISDMDKKITSYGVLNDAKIFCIAYYLDDGSGHLGNELYISLLRKEQNKWIHGMVKLHVGGSITKIHYSKNYIYLHAHMNPSAGTTLILSNELKFKDDFFGGVLAIFDDDTVVYHHNQIHFASFRYAEISIYNPRTGLYRQIYPMKPFQKIRLEHIKKVKAAYDKRGEHWFMTHNHHMNPELFNNHLASEVMVNNSTHSLAFVIAYDNKEYLNDEDNLNLNFGTFRRLRKTLEESEIKAPLSDALFSALNSDLRQDAVLKPFEDDKELHRMLQDALETLEQEGRNWRQHLNSLDANWENPEIWKRIAKIIPPEFTEVVYIYRNVNNSEEITYKEILLSDLKKRYGDIPISEYLKTERLNEIFIEEEQ